MSSFENIRETKEKQHVGSTSLVKFTDKLLCLGRLQMTQELAQRQGEYCAEGEISCNQVETGLVAPLELPGHLVTSPSFLFLAPHLHLALLCAELAHEGLQLVVSGRPRPSGQKAAGG